MPSADTAQIRRAPSADRAPFARHGREPLGVFLGHERFLSKKESGTLTGTVQWPSTVEPGYACCLSSLPMLQSRLPTDWSAGFKLFGKQMSEFQNTAMVTKASSAWQPWTRCRVSK
jgi:hypothetical protein